MEPELVNHPDHYNSEPFEAIEICRLMPFSIGNAFKYRYRCGSKPGESVDREVSKAAWYETDHLKNRSPLTGLSRAQYDYCVDLVGKIQDERKRGVLLEVVKLAAAEQEPAIYQLFYHCLDIVSANHQERSLKKRTLDALRVAIANLKYLGEKEEDIKEKVNSYLVNNHVWEQLRWEIMKYLFEGPSSQLV